MIVASDIVRCHMPDRFRRLAPPTRRTQRFPAPPLPTAFPMLHAIPAPFMQRHRQDGRPSILPVCVFGALC